MKLTQVRYFSHASIILICCCISIAFAASAAAARFSLVDWIELSPNNPPPARSYLAMTYDPVSGKYGLAIQRLLQVLGSATALAMGAFLWVNFRRDRRQDALGSGRSA